MPKVIIVNIPMMYHCVLHVQSMLLTSTASMALIFCMAMFATETFNLDCPYIIYIIISVRIRVISAAVNISMSAKKLFRNDQNFEISSDLSTSCSFLSRIFLLFLYWICQILQCFWSIDQIGVDFKCFK